MLLRNKITNIRTQRQLTLTLHNNSSPLAPVQRSRATRRHRRCFRKSSFRRSVRLAASPASRALTEIARRNHMQPRQGCSEHLQMHLLPWGKSGHLARFSRAPLSQLAWRSEPALKSCQSNCMEVEMLLQPRWDQAQRLASRLRSCSMREPPANAQSRILWEMRPWKLSTLKRPNFRSYRDLQPLKAVNQLKARTLWLSISCSPGQSYSDLE